MVTGTIRSKLNPEANLFVQNPHSKTLLPERCLYCFYCFSLPNVITECSIPETWDTLDGSSDENVFNFPKSHIIWLNPLMNHLMTHLINSIH